MADSAARLGAALAALTGGDPMFVLSGRTFMLFDEIRPDPRFQAIMAKLRLPP